jgi:hypothetical protein
MPAVSKSQQRLFGMIHAYQTGKLKKAPSKIKHVASNISMTSATHFAETKHKGLRNKVKKIANNMDLVLNHPSAPKLSKRRHNMLNDYGRYLNGELENDPTEKKAGWYEDFRRNEVNHVVGHYSPKELKDMKGLDVKHGSHPDEAEDKQLIKEVVKPSAIKKQAFERGFIKAATDLGVNPLLAVNLLKKAWNLPEAASDITGIADPAKLQALEIGAAGQAVGGAGLGGLAGAGLGGLAGYFGGRNKEHPEQDHSMRDMLLGGLGGAGLGAAGGGLYGGMHGAKPLQEYIQSHPRIMDPQQ